MNPNTDTSPVPPAPPAETPPNRPLLTKRFHSAYITALILILLGAGAFVAFRKTKKFGAPSGPQAFSVLTINPYGGVVEPGTEVRITFNYPVDLTSAEKSVEFHPFVPGSFAYGASEMEIVFKPQGGFIPGSQVKVLVKQGLKAKTGQILAKDYAGFFSIALAENAIVFMANGMSLKFMSFDRENLSPIAVVWGKDVKNPKVKIYKAADAQSLLGSLAQDTAAGYGYNQPYVEKPVDFSKLTLIKEIDSLRENNQLELPKNEPGLYLLAGFEGQNFRSTAWAAVNDIGIHFKQDDQKIYLAAQNLQTGEPENGIKAHFFKIAQTGPEELQKANLDGIQTYNFSYPKTVDVIVAQKGLDILIIPVALPNSQAEIRVWENLEEKYTIFVYTDKPIYRPGDTVKFRGLVRRDRDARFALPPIGTKVKMDGNSFAAYGYFNPGRDTFKLETQTREGGVFYSEYLLPEDFAQGNVSLYARVEVEGQPAYASVAYAYFDVQKFHKAEFELKVSLAQSAYVRGDILKAAISAKNFKGQPLSGQTLSYAVYTRPFLETEKAVFNEAFNLNIWGGMCGGGFSPWENYYGEEYFKPVEIQLDAQGRAEISLPLTQPIREAYFQQGSQELTVVAEKLDAAGNKIVAASTAKVHAGEFNIFLRPGSRLVGQAGKISAIFYAETSNGNEVADAEFDYALIKEKYDQTGRRSEERLFSGKTRTNTQGLGFIETLYPQDQLTPGSGVALEIAGLDRRGNKIFATQYYYPPSPYTAYERPLILNVKSEESNLMPGETASLEIESPAEITALVSFERGRVYQPAWLKLNAGMNKFEFVVNDEFMPSITPTFSFFYQGRFYLEGLTLNVPALKKILNVQIIPDKTRYQPGETAFLTIVTEDTSGKGVPAQVGVGIVDKAVLALRKSAVQPLHSSFWFFRPRRTNASSSLTPIGSFGDGKGGGGGDGAGGLLMKDVDTLFWQPNLSTDANGLLLLQVPVGSAETSWQALVYASTLNTDLGQAGSEFVVAR